jgi:hypothetical protein
LQQQQQPQPQQRKVDYRKAVKPPAHDVSLFE